MQRAETGEGYVYYRDRSRGLDVTVYEHQLVALIDTDPAQVFADDHVVHHDNRIRLDNRRCNLEVVRETENVSISNRRRAAGGTV